MKDKTAKTDLIEKKASRSQNRLKRLQNIKEAAERHKMKYHSA
ncbi:MAG: hypothetical protein ABSC14_08045 [Desulfomonilia bacterium]|jgi:hypothetical protein